MAQLNTDANADVEGRRRHKKSETKGKGSVLLLFASI
jgi:hypothetical protein